MRILIAECAGFSEEAKKITQSIGDVHLADLDRNGLRSSVVGKHVLWVRLRNNIDEDLFSVADELRVIVSATTGLNHIDMEAAQRRDIAVLSLRGHVDFLQDIRATSEHTIALMLSLLRRIPGAVQDVIRGNWDRDNFKGRELYKKTVGIVGFGRVGRIVAQYLSAFGATCVITDPYVNPQEFPELEFLTLQDLLSVSDIVTIHVDLREETENLIGREQIDQMNRGTILINTSRGSVIDELALLDALENNIISGAALDVLRAEDSLDATEMPLVQFASKSNRLIITPHVGGCTAESMEKTEIFMANQLVSHLQRKGSDDSCS